MEDGLERARGSVVRPAGRFYDHPGEKWWGLS